MVNVASTAGLGRRFPPTSTPRPRQPSSSSPPNGLCLWGRGAGERHRPQHRRRFRLGLPLRSCGHGRSRRQTPLRRPARRRTTLVSIFYLLAGAGCVTGQCIVMDGGGARAGDGSLGVQRRPLLLPASGAVPPTTSSGNGPGRERNPLGQTRLGRRAHRRIARSPCHQSVFAAKALRVAGASGAGQDTSFSSDQDRSTRPGGPAVMHQVPSSGASTIDRPGARDVAASSDRPGGSASVMG